MEIAPILALLAQLPLLIQQFQELYTSIVSTLSEDDKAKLDARLAELRARMPQIQADTDAALLAAGGAG